MLDRNQLLQFVKQTYGTVPDYPWPRHPSYAVLRHKGNQKWYGLIMNVQNNRLGLAYPGFSEIVNVKCPPELVGSLRMKQGILPAYHMNKEHWLTLLLDGSIPVEEIFGLLAQSYEITKG